MTSKRTALIIGCGSIGQRHARLLGERDDIDVWACDPVPKNLEEVQEKASISKSFSDHKAALREGPDLAWICTPNSLHAPISIDALEAGTHVLCEKPLADTVEAGQAIVDAVEATGRTLMVGYTMRWWPAFQFIHQAIQQGKIGTAIGARTRLHGYRSLEWARSDYRSRERAAILLDYSHEIDYLRWFLGDIVEAKAFATTMGNRERIVSPNIVVAILQFEGGQVATLHFDYVQRPDTREVDIFADDGMLHYNTSDDYLKFYVGQEGACQEIPGKLADYDDPYRDEIHAFLDAVDGKCKPEVSAHDGLEVLKIVFGLADSYEAASV